MERVDQSTQAVSGTHSLLSLSIRLLPLSKARRLEAWWYLLHSAEQNDNNINFFELTNFDLGLDKSLLSQTWESAKYLLESLQGEGIGILVYGDHHYPHSFAKLKQEAPLVLFYKGDPTILNEENKVALIGTRTPSKKSTDKAYTMARYHALQKRVVVSGLALGCDTAAHQGALKEKGMTIATLPSPIAKIYPRENKKLAAEIAQSGCLLSEYLPKDKTKTANFIERDKHQALLSSAIYLIESELKGGSMHTMRFGYSFGRELHVFKPNTDVLWQSPDFEGNRYCLEHYRGTIFH